MGRRPRLAAAVREVVRRRHASTSPSTASTGTSRPATATRSRCTGRASPATPAPSPTPSCKDEVCQAANALTALGVEAGDRVAIYLPMIPEAMVAMLACARIGAPHSVVFGGFSAEALAVTHRRRRAPRSSSPPTAATGAAQPSALKPAVDEALEMSEGKTVEQRARRTPHRAGRRLDRRPRRLVARRRRRPTSTEHEAAGRSTPSTRCSSSTRPAPPGSRRASCTPPAATSPRSPYTHRERLRPQAGDRRLLVHGRHRLGHRAQLHRLRAAGQRRDPGDVRGHAGHPAQGPLVGARREVRRDDPLHRADRDPHVHEVGRGDPRRARPVVAAAARLGRRADQPRGVDLVPPGHRRRPHARSSTPGGRPRPAPS